MDGNSHVMNDILYENTGYLSLPFHDIYAKKEGRQLIQPEKSTLKSSITFKYHSK